MATLTKDQAGQIVSWFEWLPGITSRESDSVQNILETTNGTIRSIFQKINRDEPMVATMVTDMLDEFDLTGDLNSFLNTIGVKIRGKYS